MKSKLNLGEVLEKWTQEPVPKPPIKKPVLVKLGAGGKNFDVNLWEIVEEVKKIV